MKKFKNVLLVMVLLLVVVTGCGKKDLESSANTNEGMVKNQLVDGISFTNTSVVVDKDNKTKLSVTLTNTNKENKKVAKVNAIVKDKDNKQIVTFDGIVGKDLKPEETFVLSVMLDASLTDGYTIEYSFK